MQNLPVHWSEGLFLQPHHLQASDRYWAEALHTSEHLDHHYHYGLRWLEFSHDAIGNAQFQLNACHARMKDGTLVTLEPGQEPDRVDLKPAFAQEERVRVFLAVPKLKLGRANVARDGDSEKHRYVENRQSVQDESSGGNDQEIAFRDLNVRLLLSTDDAAGYELLPIAQVQRAGERQAAPQIDASYIPPVLAIDAWPPLGRDIVRAIYDMIGKKIEVLAAQIINREVSLVQSDSRDIDRLLMLAELNAAYATLSVLTFASGVHPLTAYRELVRILGQLSIFNQEARRPPEIPRYDHDDLARIFYWVKEQIERHLSFVGVAVYEHRFFVGEGNMMRVSIDPRWLQPDWKWYVGVKRGVLDDKQCIAVLSPGYLNWKLGSERQVEDIFRRGLEGLHLTHLTQAPAILPPREWLYFEVSRGNVYWRDVLDHQTLAMRLQERLIANREAIQGTSTLIVTIGNKQYPLQFALFAVPQQQ
jgi:type VI secretion system protein ImpJ